MKPSAQPNFSPPKNFRPRSFLRFFAFLAFFAAIPSPPTFAAELLPNGITLPTPWPPQRTAADMQSLAPMPVPYLTNPPAVIPVNLGRQLFVDDFLIESNTLKRTWHPATLHSNNPVLKPDREWEKLGGAMAMPFSDGVWLDPWCPLTPPQFKPEEIQDPVALVERLLNPGTNAPAKFLSEQLTGDARDTGCVQAGGCRQPERDAEGAGHRVEWRRQRPADLHGGAVR